MPIPSIRYSVTQDAHTRIDETTRQSTPHVARFETFARRCPARYVLQGVDAAAGVSSTFTAVPDM